MLERLFLVAGAVSCAGLSGLAAQDDVSRSLSNNIGLITYCRDAGIMQADTAAAALQRTMHGMELLDGAELDEEAVEAGRRGLWGTRAIPVATRAALFDQDVEEFCGELVAGF